MINVAEILPANLPDSLDGRRDQRPGDCHGVVAEGRQDAALEDGQGRDRRRRCSARFTQLADGSAPWPCDFSAAQTVKIKVAPGPGGGGGGGAGGGATGGGTPPPTMRVAEADFEPSQIQDLGDLIPALLEIKAKCKVAMKFHVRLELGDGKTKPSDAVVSEVNAAIKDLDDGSWVE